MHNIWDDNLHHNSFDSDCEQFWCKLVVMFYGTAVNSSIKCWLVVTWMHNDSGYLDCSDLHIFFMAVIWHSFLECSSSGCYTTNPSKGRALKIVHGSIRYPIKITIGIKTPKNIRYALCYTNITWTPQKIVSICKNSSQSIFLIMLQLSDSFKHSLSANNINLVNFWQSTDCFSC